MPEWLPNVLPYLVSGLTLLAGWFVAGRAARRFMAIGGEEAQTKLNDTLRELADAYEEKLTLRNSTIEDLSRDFAACKSRLAKVERSERELKQDVHDLRDELRQMRQRTGLAGA